MPPRHSEYDLNDSTCADDSVMVCSSLIAVAARASSKIENMKHCQGRRTTWQTPQIKPEKAEVVTGIVSHDFKL